MRQEIDLLTCDDPEYAVVTCKVRLPIREAHKMYRELQGAIQLERIRERQRLEKKK